MEVLVIGLFICLDVLFCFNIGLNKLLIINAVNVMYMSVHIGTL